VGPRVVATSPVDTETPVTPTSAPVTCGPQPLVRVTVSVAVAHPVWHVAHLGTVVVAVFGQQASAHGTVTVRVSRRMHMGTGGHVAASKPEHGVAAVAV